MLRRELLIVLGIYLLLCAIYFAWSLAVTEPGFPLDDSWIHMVFAKNIATGHGFSFNPDVPVAGATAPLWTLFIVPFWLILGPVAGGIIPGLILQCLAIIAIYKLAELLLNDKKLAFWSALAMAITWVLVWGGLSGMEVGLYSALSLWGLYLYFKADSPGDPRNYAAYGMFVLSFMARPECGLFLAAVALNDFISWIRSEKKSMWPWFWRSAIVAALLAPYIAFNYSTTGTIFPQTYTAKVAGRGFFSAIINGEILRIIKSLTINPAYNAEDFWLHMLAVSPLLTMAFVPGILKVGKIADGLRSKRIMLIVLILLYVPLMGTFSPVMNPTYHSMRRVHNLIPLIFIFSLAGIFYQEKVRNLRLERFLKFFFVITMILGLIMALGGNVIVEKTASFMTQDPTKITAKSISDIISFVTKIGLGLFTVSLAVLVGLMLFAGDANFVIRNSEIRTAVIAFVIAYSFGILIYGGDHYANSIKNINECDKGAALYLKEHARPGDVVAVNDVGAIKYFSDLEIFDLAGLVSPELTLPMILDDSLAFEYMLAKRRVDYVAIFPAWFKYIPRRTDILKPMTMFIASRNTVLGDDTTIVYKAVWPDSLK